MANVAVIIQARMGSSRLPGKVMLSLPTGRTVIEEIILRCQGIRVPGHNTSVIVATPAFGGNEVLEEHMRSSPHVDGFMIYTHSGKENDVLSRYRHASNLVDNVDHIMRITADCPCLDASVCNLILDSHIKSCSDYSSNTLSRTYPHGYDCEVFTRAALYDAYDNASSPYDREHVTPYIKAEAELISSVEADSYEGHIRLTLDTIEDYYSICKYMVLHEAS